MSLREVVNEFKRSRSIIRLPHLPAVLKTEKSYKRISEKYGEIGAVEIVDYRALLDRLKAAAESGSIEKLTYRDLRLGASCVFDGKPRLADNKHFLDLYLGALRTFRSRLAVKRLIYSYCLHFDPKDAAI